MPENTRIPAGSCRQDEREGLQLIERMARPEGFEPPTLCFGGTRSIHLSYGRAANYRYPITELAAFVLLLPESLIFLD